MNKRQYMQPQLHVVNVNIGSSLLAGSVKQLNNNVGMGLGGGSSTAARSRGADDWFDDEEE